MTLEPLLIYDPVSTKELIFESVEDGIEKTFSNEATNFKRTSDGTYETYLDSPGSRVVSFTIRTSNPSYVRRLLDYFSRKKRYLILALGTYDFSSEVLIKSYKHTEVSASVDIIDVSFSCYGDVGQVRVAADPDCTGATVITDSNALSGSCARLSAINDTRKLSVSAGVIYMANGAYTFLVRAYSSAGVTNDFNMQVYDVTSSTELLTLTTTVTTSSYKYYILQGSVPSSSMGHTIEIRAKKVTSTTNNIYIDLIAYMQASQVIDFEETTPDPTAYDVTLNPTADNRMRSATATTVYATDTYIDLGNSSSSSVRPLLKFDLSGIPSNATVTSAILQLYWYHPSGTTRTNDTIVQVYRPASAWNPSYVCWSNRDSGTAWSNAGGDWRDSTNTAQGTSPFASVTFAGSTVPDNAYHDWDITTLIQAYVNGTYTDTGILMKASAESGNYIAFYSQDASNYHPRLVIHYTVPA